MVKVLTVCYDCYDIGRIIFIYIKFFYFYEIALFIFYICVNSINNVTVVTPQGIIYR
jgi:hypothetical protein